MLVDRGLGRDNSFAAIHADKSPESVAALLGVSKIDMAYIPIAKNATETRLEQILSNPGVQCVFSDDNNISRAANPNALQVPLSSLFSIKKLLNNIFELELPSLKLKEIGFKLKLNSSVPDIIISDKEKVYHILLNILSNAIKFTHDGSITIEINVIEANGEDIKLCFKVIDTGIGIPEEDIHKVFDQFYRTTSSYEGNFEGCGVGLHIAREYLDRLQGVVDIQSEVGTGTTISLTIPMKKASDTLKIENELETALPQKNSNINIKSNPNNEDAFVLLVEDNYIARKTAISILTKSGCRVMQADTSEAAFELCQKHRFDFILSDIGLPDYSGIDLTKKIHAFEKENKLKETPIIGLSAHAQGDTFEDAKRAGMLDLAEKPLKTGMVEKLIYIFGYSKSRTSPAPDSTTLNPVADMNKINTSSQLPLLDVEQALSQIGDKTLLKELLEQMINDSMINDINIIEKNYNDQDWQALKKSAHKFKSTCLYCATTSLLTLTQKLETLADTNDINQIRPVYLDFLDCAEKTKKRIDTWLNNEI